MNTPFHDQVVCGIWVSFCEPGGNSLWLAKLARSSHVVTGDGSFGSMSAAITKPQSADTTIERSKAPCGTRIGVVADKAATSSVIQALYSVPEVGFAERSPLTSSEPVSRQPGNQ